jgi:hypothetical protein
VAGPFTNQIPLQYLPLGSLLTQTLTTSPSGGTVGQAALLGVTVATPFPGFTGTIGQALKPYPQYNGLADPWLDVGSESYNSLQASFNRRMSNGLAVVVSYVYSKEMDDLAGVRLPGADYLENSVGTLDHKHVLAVTGVYQLPFGPGRHWNSDNIIVKGIANGWQLTGIFTAATGAPLSITGTCQGGGIIDASCYPNYTPGFSGSVWQNGRPATAAAAKATAYLNKLAFTDPANYAYGNAARTAPDDLFAPRTADIDFSIRRVFPIYEAVNFTLQVDAFNVENATYFSAPNTSRDASAFGTYSGQANQARKFQFSGRVNF